MKTLKIRLAVAVMPDGHYQIIDTQHRSAEGAMDLALRAFLPSTRDFVRTYWVDFELPIPDSPIPVHKATVTAVNQE